MELPSNSLAGKSDISLMFIFLVLIFVVLKLFLVLGESMSISFFGTCS
jgi:hypothetical protein